MKKPVLSIHVASVVLVVIFFISSIIIKKDIFSPSSKSSIERKHVLGSTVNTFSLPFETVSVDEIIHGNLEKPERFRAQLSQLLNILVKDYISFHKETREKCEGNETFASTTKLLVFRGCSRNYGIGDRIRAILEAFIVSSMSRRLLLIDLPDPLPLSIALSNAPGVNFTFDPYLFPVDELNGSIHDVRVITNMHVREEYSRYAVQTRVIIQRAMNPLRVSKLFRSSALFPEFHVQRGRNGIDNFEPHEEELVPFILRALFRPSHTLRSKLFESRPFDTNNYLSIHARLGRGVKEMHDRFNGSIYGLTSNEVGACIGKFGGRAAKARNLSNIFVATDTKDANASISDGIRSVFPGANIRFATGQAVHLRSLRGKEMGEAELESFMTVFQDAALLGIGKSLVFYASGFADFAQWLGAITDGQSVSLSDCQKEFKRS